MESRAFEISSSCGMIEGKDAFLIKIGGHFDSSNVKDFEACTRPLCADELLTKAVLDLGTLSFIASAGLGVMMGLFHDLKERGGDLFVINAQPRIFRILKDVGLVELLQVSAKDEDNDALLKGFADAC